ncbi:D-methionine transport system permease protein [Kutzneria viridogrisea]|nr:methionine ABC transporter permease [Kutzneria albida]MBA8929826.1 D-methionine transport system permease protein [Kutzneria viridogrisea]
MRPTTPWSEVLDLLQPAFGQTLYMISVATVFATLFGIPLGVLLHVSAPNGLRPLPVLHRILGVVADFGRSVPFIVLIVLLQQIVTRPLLSTSIGPTAAIVPLAIGAVPFLGRLVQSALREVDATVVEAAVTTGASRLRIVRSVLLGESAPALVSAVGVTAVTLVGFSAIAGVVGGGGLGDLAIRYGYQRYDDRIMWTTVIVIGLLAMLLQFLFDRVARLIDRRRHVTA